MKNFEEFCVDYSDIASLARGGQKLVYSAYHAEYGNVVIKLFFKLDDPRGLREIDIGLNIALEGVPAIHDTGCLLHEGIDTLYVVEQKIQGEDLRKMLNRGERFNLSQAVVFLEQCLQFVQQIEKRGIVHRDINPNNIIITDEGKVYFIDFGIARVLGLPSLTKTELVVGPHTPGYAAPEQFNNLKDSIDSRTDLFSVGVVTYECLTGQNPFIEGARSHLEILQKTETLTPVAYTIKGDTQQQFMALISTLMGKYPSRRPKDAKQALTWLHAAERTFEY